MEQPNRSTTPAEVEVHAQSPTPRQQPRLILCPPYTRVHIRTHTHTHTRLLCRLGDTLQLAGHLPVCVTRDCHDCRRSRHGQSGCQCLVEGGQTNKCLPIECVCCAEKQPAAQPRSVAHSCPSGIGLQSTKRPAGRSMKCNSGRNRAWPVPVRVKSYSFLLSPLSSLHPPPMKKYPSPNAGHHVARHAESQLHALHSRSSRLGRSDRAAHGLVEICGRHRPSGAKGCAVCVGGRRMKRAPSHNVSGLASANLRSVGFRLGIALSPTDEDGPSLPSGRHPRTGQGP
ncbi:unnamed protein product [Protopolystoma xenopodis]|uniref:Uncharacterized protein n=1 Tax=Protopolystoma xenopodis TaxID=117903 RepID=A0A448WC77_9PLAT|nr:unnamed protein product [Protopolystoma xenopodis]